jgi:hypothetical protein
MKMKIDEEYYIEIDSFCWTLTFERTKYNDEKGKNITTTNRTYHASLKQALNTYVDVALKPVPDVTMVIKALGEIETKIENLVKQTK